MKIRKLLIVLGCLLLSVSLTVAFAEGAPEEAFSDYVDFRNANIAFLDIFRSPPDAGQPVLSAAQQGGAWVAKLEMAGEGKPYLLIDVASLLGDGAKAFFSMELKLEAQNPQGVFHAVSGEIFAYSGVEPIGRPTSWSIYLAGKNPNLAKFNIADANIPEGEAVDLIIVNKKVDNAIESGEAPANLILHEIRFFDSQGNLLPVNENATLHLPDGFGEADRTNLVNVTNETVINGAEGESSGWGQAVVLPTAKNEGVFDASLIVPGCVITVNYASESAPELILQSWTDGAPEQASWAKAAPAAINDSGTICQFVYEDLVSAFGGDDFTTYLDQLYVGDTGAALAVTAVTIGLME